MEGCKILIVEDEFIIAEHLRSVLQLLGHRVTGIAGRVSEALDSLRQDPPDLVLLDVNLRGELDGIDLAGRLRAEHRIPFIFLTSQANAATVARAKQTRPYGYLVKPFGEQDIYVALEMALATAAAERAAAPAPPTAQPAALPAAEALATGTDGLFLRDRKQMVKVKFSDLCWLEADGNYTTLHTTAGKLTTCHPLRHVEGRLPPAHFVRVHKSYIVALHRISAFDSQALTVEGEQVPVGRAYQTALMGRLNLLGST